jgi:signal peptide peptidase SppA
MSKAGRNKGAGNFGFVLGHLYGGVWAITPAKFSEIERVVKSRIDSGRGFDFDRDEDGPTAAGRRGSNSPDNGYTLFGSAAVVPISGTITPRPSMFSDYSGGTSANQIGAAVDAAVVDPNVSAIVLDIDSPGGYVAGITEAAAKIASANKQKPVTAVANHLAASAAYWLASQAGEIVVSPSAQVGSIGVLSAHVDETKLEEMAGVRTSLVHNSQSPFKTEGYPQVPLSIDARADMQRTVDALAQQFIDAVAKGRGIRSTTVERDFGQGRMKLAGEAVSARMADRVATLEQVVNEANRAGSSRRGARAGTAEQELRLIAAEAAASGVRVPASNDPATARRQLRVLQVAKVVAEENRDEADRAERERAGKRPAAVPTSREGIRLAVYRAERGLPTN